MAQRGFEGLSAREELDVKDRAMDEAPIGITLSDPSRDDNPMIYINEAFEDLTGYDATEVIGRNCRFLQGADTDPAAPDAMRRAIDAGETVNVELVNYRKDGEPFWNEVTIAPVHDDDGELTHFVGFQRDVTARVEAERALERERERLDHVVERIEGLVADVTADVIQAESRADVHQVLCDRIVEAEPYRSACVLRTDLDEAHRVAAHSGLAGSDAALADRRWRVDDGSPLAAASDRSEAATVTVDEWRAAVTDGAAMVATDSTTVAVLPIAYGDVGYGALVVGSEATVDDRELAVLSALTRTAATAINALERGQMLTASSAVEVTFGLPDADLFLAEVAEATGDSFEVLGFVRRADGGVSLILETDGPADRFVGHDGLPSDVTVHSLRELADGAVVDVRMTDPWIFDDVAERAGEVVALEVEDGTVEIGLRAPHRDAVRDLRDYVVDRFPDATLLGSTEVDGSREEVTVTDPLTDLTDKQREALQKAYYGGYFDRPRAVTGDDLAETMDISRATFNQHLRTGERKLLAAAFEGSRDT